MIPRTPRGLWAGVCDDGHSPLRLILGFLGVLEWLRMRDGVLLRHRKYHSIGETIQGAVYPQSILSQQSTTI